MSETEGLISHDYSHYYEQYQLVGSLEVYLPLIKMDLMMDYMCKAPMEVIEEYICRCIKQGITDRQEIADVLVLKNTVINPLIDELIKQEIIKEESGKLEFIKGEYVTVENIKTMQHKKRAVAWCYKGLMNADRKIDTHMKSIKHTVNIEQVLEDEHSFYFLPNVLIEVKPTELKALNIKMFHYLKPDEESIEIQHLEILKERTVLYELYKICFFKGVEGDVKLLVHKADGEQEIDHAFTKTIQRLYDRSQFFNQIRYASQEDEDQLEALNKQIRFMTVSK